MNQLRTLVTYFIVFTTVLVKRLNSILSPLLRYLALKQPDNITQCMYVWIDGTGEHLRAKTKTVKFVPKKPAGG